MGELAELLLERELDRSQHWPPPRQQDVWAIIERWRAYRESDRATLEVVSQVRDVDFYRVDPLPEKASEAWAALLFGRPPEVTVDDDADQDQWERIEDAIRLGSELYRNELVCSSEGEVWWRWNPDPVRHPEAPMLSWHSRRVVIPLFLNGALRACAFYTELDPWGDDDAVYWRHFEIHEAGEITNWLYRGVVSSIGDRVDLARHPDVADVAERWQHGLPMLAGRIVNKWGADPTLGVSDYHGIEDFFLELNAILNTGARNRGLSGEQRAVVPATALDEFGNLPPGNVISTEAINSVLGEGDNAAKAFGLIDFKFDASQLIAWQNQIATLALGRIGITPQFAGQPAGPEGYASTGTALRMRLLPSVVAGDAKYKQWADDLPEILSLGIQLDARTGDDMAYGNPWRDPEAVPAVKRAEALPEDPMERDTRLAVATAGKQYLSTWGAIRERHPEWSPEQVDEEAERITEETASAVSSVTIAGGRGDVAGGSAPEVPAASLNGDTAPVPAGDAEA